MKLLGQFHCLVVLDIVKMDQLTVYGGINF